MSVRPQTIAKYASFLTELREWCAQTEPLNLLTLVGIYKLSGRVPMLLRTMNIVVEDSKQSSGFTFCDTRHTTIISRELSHALYKADLASRGTRVKRVKAIEQPKPEPSITDEPAKVEPSSNGLFLTEMDRQLLKLVLASTQEPDLIPFAKKMLDRI